MTFGISRGAPDLLRAALDREGGEQIGIDFALLIPHTLLQDPNQRNQLRLGLTGLPYENLTLRLSGFGAMAGPLTMKRTIRAIQELHTIGPPIVLDHIGGLISTGALALGYVSGIAHGIGEKERFDARHWHKPPMERDPDASGGRSTFIPMPDFDRSFRKKDLDLIERVAGGRILASCDDPLCCPHGLKSLRENPKAHIAYQRFTSIQTLQLVPDRHRAKHFLDTEVRSAERKARDLVRLQTGDDSLNRRLAEGRKRIDSVTKTFETLVAQVEVSSLPPIVRGMNSPGMGSTRLV